MGQKNTNMTVHACKATADLDPLYVHKANALQLNIGQQITTKIYTIAKFWHLPEEATVLPAV
jgi:hypothetical protein